MITKEQFMNGLVKYIDIEVIPVLSTAGKWGVGTIVYLMRNKAEEVINSLTMNPLVQSLGVVSSDGLIDAELFLAGLKSSAEHYGKLQVVIPIVGTLTFSCDDVDKLKEYMVSQPTSVAPITMGVI